MPGGWSAVFIGSFSAAVFGFRDGGGGTLCRGGFRRVPFGETGAGTELF
jgi:hypothetical protein